LHCKEEKMNKGARFVSVWLAAAVIAGLAGCARKPAYSEIDANRSARAQNNNQPNDAQETASTPNSTAPPASPAPASPPTTPFKTPTFMDQASGEIKDLPSYPRAYRVSAQVGPVQGVNSMSLALKTSDSMDKIAAFYEKVFKDHKWTVTDKINDPELSEWNLKKGESNIARVQVKKDPQQAIMNIIIVRTEKMDEPARKSG
jgi:hypothetical protein